MYFKNFLSSSFSFPITANLTKEPTIYK